MINSVILGIWYSRKHLIHSYLIIPLGILIILTILYGFNILLTQVFKIKFPCSVLGLLINLIFLCILSILGDSDIKYIKNGSSWLLTNYLILIKPPMNFTLKWINVFFIPSFIILPLSDPITFIECVKIAAVFIFGMIILFICNVYFIKSLKFLLSIKQDKKEEEIELIETSSSNVFTSMRDDITTIDVDSLRHVKTEPNVTKTVENPFEETVSLPEPVYPKRNHVRRSPPLSFHEPPKQIEVSHIPKLTIFVSKYIDWILYSLLFIISLPLYYISSIHVFLPYHLSITILAYYTALLIPQYYPQTKKFAHPILISTAIILFICFIGSLIYHKNPKGFLNDLKFYKTGKNYLRLFNNKILNNNGKSNEIPEFTATPKWPGCGDFLSSLMDVSIVALSLPMFTHRKDFIKNFWLLMPTILLSVGLTFFIYPLFCNLIGIEAHRSIGFIGRSVTLALGTPLIKALGGSVSLMAVCTILSGILGVLLNEPIFKLLRVAKGDFVTRGVSLGINCGAIATAHLLNVDPRAASMSSLSFSVFGTVMVIMASINAIRELVRSWVGL
ncbi:unnamed protein product [Candida verbasci]|uniref:Uncharacterized protein n=1 Tax=Candida verbasci TaxID=1227364 RepID=A0A9W4TW46_9ASCO|nr:unnamed protein product [Candida verbasci]